MSEDRRRVLADYGQMADLYADDAALDPIKVSYDRPTILGMAGEVRGKRVLDVGCASGGLSEALVERGASVVGVDLNPRLIERARGRLGSRAEFCVADIAAPMPFLETGSFDVVAASLVLHYLADWGPPLREFARILRPGGVLLLSTHHPTQDVMIATPPAPYFETVLLTDTWRKGGREFQVRFYHRPISAIVDALADAGFLIERIPEPVPDPTAFSDRAFYDRMRRGPWFLFIRAVSPPGGDPTGRSRQGRDGGDAIDMPGAGGAADWPPSSAINRALLGEVAGPRLVHTPSEPSGSQRSPAVRRSPRSQGRPCGTGPGIEP